MLVEFKFHGPVGVRVTGPGETSVVTDVPGPGGPTVVVMVLFLERPGRPPVARQLKAVCGPGDDGAPVLTPMLPEED